MGARAELLQAAVLPADLAQLAIDGVRGHGGTSLGVVGNIVAMWCAPGGMRGAFRPRCRGCSGARDGATPRHACMR
ncbi:hypothetical protein [Xanthomonas tesorieronis]|uniref:hypothetical protein n=1 Tax=Xanthomonas tesorieronis TaxID=3160839 RepID=UPI0035148F7A